MADQQQEVTIKFSLPDPITVAVWQSYTAGSQAYNKRQTDADLPTSVLLGNYHGALAAIRDGFVHIEGPESIKKILQAEDQSRTPLAVVGLVLRGVATPIEAALNGPLELAFLNGS